LLWTGSVIQKQVSATLLHLLTHPFLTSFLKNVPTLVLKLTVQQLVFPLMTIWVTARSVTMLSVAVRFIHRVQSLLMNQLNPAKSINQLPGKKSQATVLKKAQHFTSSVFFPTVTFTQIFLTLLQCSSRQRQRV